MSGKTASIYKLAYQDKFADLSVGSILTARLMQHVIDIDGVTHVDYLTGDDAYKRDWDVPLTLLHERGATWVSTSLLSGHPWVPFFRSVGFVARGSAPLMFHAPALDGLDGMHPAGPSWFVAAGDRDC